MLPTVAQLRGGGWLPEGQAAIDHLESRDICNRKKNNRRRGAGREWRIIECERDPLLGAKRKELNGHTITDRLRNQGMNSRLLHSIKKLKIEN